MRHIAGIDHVVISVRDLDAARDSFARLGFTLTPRGHHNLGSQNHCITLGADYIELLAVSEPHPALRYFHDFAVRGDGLSGIALATNDADGAHAELERAGIAAAPPLDISRSVELPDGIRTASFRVVLLPPGTAPGCFVFVCQQLTREHVWRSEYQTHPIGATAIAELAIVDDDPLAAAERYARILGVPPERAGDGWRIRSGDVSLGFGSRASVAHRLEGVALSSRPPPLVAALFLRVADRAAAADLLRRGGCAPIELGDGSLAVGADRAHGTALVFV